MSQIENEIEIGFEPLFHITNRSQNRERFQVPLDEAWDIVCVWLKFVTFAYKIKIHSCLLMPNHIHIMASGMRSVISSAMRYFFTETSRTMNKLSFKINHTWGTNYRPTLINSYVHYLNAYKYIYLNPVDAKLVARVEDYPYSTLLTLIGQQDCNFPVVDDVFFSGDPAKILAWINQMPEPKEMDAVRKALRREVFKYPKIDSRPNPLERRRL